ncbi:hypothetical protein ALC56_04043, partial [Trachymyrmex septentrionalis]
FFNLINITKGDVIHSFKELQLMYDKYCHVFLQKLSEILPGIHKHYICNNYLDEAYGEATLSERSCCEWFQKFKTIPKIGWIASKDEAFFRRGIKIFLTFKEFFSVNRIPLTNIIEMASDNASSFNHFNAEVEQIFSIINDVKIKKRN